MINRRLSCGFQNACKTEWINLISLFIYFCLTGGVNSLSQNISVPDQLSAGSYVGKIGSGLSGVSGPFSVFADVTTTAVFNISPVDGSIRSKVKVERSRQVYYYMTAFSSSGLQVDVTLVVVISGNRAPMFRPNSVNITLPIEQQIEGSLIFVATVFDPDDKGVISRSDTILPSSENARRFPFALKTTQAPDGAQTLELQIISVSYLSISHSFVVRATDNGSPPLQTDLTVDIYVAGKGGNKSNHAPVFDKGVYKLLINENLQARSALVQIQATDPDLGNILSYSFESPYPQFSIHPTTGWITLVSPLDADKSPFLILIVVASDSYDKSSAQIRITVMTSPLVSITLAFLSEDGSAKIPRTANANDKVAYVSVDDVDKSFPYKITLDGGDDKFALRPAGELMCLVVVSRSLADAKTSYDMAVRFFYVAHPEKSLSKTFVLKITGTGDHNSKDILPQFDRGVYEVILTSFSQVGTSLIRVALVSSSKASDSKSSVSNEEEEAKMPKFRLRAGFFSNYFEIDSISGWIVTASLFDCSFPSRFHILVEAYQPYLIVEDLPRSVVRASVMITMDWDVRFLTEPRFDQPFYSFRINQLATGLKGCFGKFVTK